MDTAKKRRECAVGVRENEEREVSERRREAPGVEKVRGKSNGKIKNGDRELGKWISPFFSRKSESVQTWIY